MAALSLNAGTQPGGLLDLLLGNSNPAAQFVDSRRNVLDALASGLAQGPTFSQGVANGLGNIAQARAADRQQAQLQQSQNATLGFLQKYPDLLDMAKQGNVQGAWQLALQREAAAQKQQAPTDLASTYQGRVQIGTEQGLTGNDLATYALTGKMVGGNQTSRSGVGPPVFGQSLKDPNKFVPFEPTTEGVLVNLVDPNDAPSNYNFDPRIAAGQRATGTADAKNAAAARAMLPGAQQMLAITDKAVNSLRNDTAGQGEQFGNILGIPQQMLPAFPGTEKANFRNMLSQGAGQAFLQARAVLKGGGQITDYEGGKAEAAFSRMQAAANSGDATSFNAALDDFQQAVHDGYAKLVAAAQGQYAAGGPGLAAGPAASSAGNTTSSGVQWSITP